MKEFILCAAIDYNGIIICGHRHGDCYVTLRKLKEVPLEGCELPSREHQGFLTSYNRYVDRKEGFQIAKANNQIAYGLKATETEDPDDAILISENLY